MKKYVALLRGINVGAANRLSMRDLTAALEGLGAREVRTYLQSGNAVFLHASRSAPRLAAEIGAAIETAHGFGPKVLVRDAAALERAIAGNPFPEAAREPKSLHVFFLDTAPPRPDLEALARLKEDTERIALVDDLLYLHSPKGFGRSRLAAGAEAALGVPATARNWRTICELLRVA
jgi:uncharacterized protein (DUF1697 family)